MNTPEKVRADVLRALADAGLTIRGTDLKTGVGPLRKDKNGLRRDPKIWLYGGPDCRSVPGAVRVVKARVRESAAMLPFVQREYTPPSPMYSPANLPPPAGADAPPSPAPSEASTTAMSPVAPAAGAPPARPVDVPPAPTVAAPPIPFVAAAPPAPNEAGAFSNNEIVLMERLERLEQQRMVDQEQFRRLEQQQQEQSERLEQQQKGQQEQSKHLEQQVLNTSYTHGNMIRDIDDNQRKMDAKMDAKFEKMRDQNDKNERNNCKVLKALKVSVENAHTKVDVLRTWHAGEPGSCVRPRQITHRATAVRDLQRAPTAMARW